MTLSVCLNGMWFAASSGPSSIRSLIASPTTDAEVGQDRASPRGMRTRCAGPKANKEFTTTMLRNAIVSSVQHVKVHLVADLLESAKNVIAVSALVFSRDRANILNDYGLRPQAADDPDEGINQVVTWVC